MRRQRLAARQIVVKIPRHASRKHVCVWIRRSHDDCGEDGQVRCHDSQAHAHWSENPVIFSMPLLPTRHSGMSSYAAVRSRTSRENCCRVRYTVAHSSYSAASQTFRYLSTATPMPGLS